MEQLQLCQSTKISLQGAPFGSMDATLVTVAERAQ
jgi:hypothetical protein